MTADGSASEPRQRLERLIGMIRQPVAIVPLALTLWLAVGCAALRTGAPPFQVAATGRVSIVDATEGFILAEFPGGSWRMIALDKREIGRYTTGDPISIDSFGRPLVN